MQSSAQLNPTQNPIQEKALRTAAAKGDLSTVKQLVSESINVNAAGPGTKMTAMHWACSQGCMEVVKFLLSRDAEINALDDKSNSPLHYAMMANNVSLTVKIAMIQVLLNKGANPTQANNEKVTPMMQLVSIRDLPEVIQTIHLRNTVATIIRQIKEIIAEKAKVTKISVGIKPNGELIYFNDANKLVDSIDASFIPKSGQISVTVLDCDSDEKPSFAPGK